MNLRNHNRQTEGGVKETLRLEAFSDGVFAIAITLLSIELIQVLKQPENTGLLRHLLRHSNAFFAFAAGFLTILVCWINHHLVFTYIRKIDSNLMWVNGLVLLMVTFTPFATALLSDYFDREKNTALAVFGFNFFMMSVAAYWITAYTYNKGLIDARSRQLYRSFKILYKYSIVYTFLVFIVCFLSVPVAIFLYLILFIVFAYPKQFSVRLASGRIRKTK